MNDLNVRHVRACVAFVVCASMIAGMLFMGAAPVRAASDNAIFIGNVKLGTNPAADTLVMYSMDRDNPPMGNSTVTDVAGDYELWIEGGHTYWMFFANGGAMFDGKAQVQSYIGVGQTKWLNASLTPAPERTVTLKGYLTNASNASQPVTDGHVLGLRALMGGQPDYINWTVPNSTGYYEVMVLPGLVMAAVFDAPGYFPSMTAGSPLFGSPGDSLWLNMSLRPFTGYNVNITGKVTDATNTDPIANAAVTASMSDMGYSSMTTTNSTGDYLLRMVEGSGEIRVASDGFVSQRIEDVYFSGNMTQDFALNPLDAEVHGYVLDAYTGLPIPNASVIIESWSGPSYSQYNSTTSGQDGSYNLTVCGGDWYLYGSAIGYGEQETYVTLVTSDLVEKNISLIPQSSMIKGYATDSVTGLPIEAASIAVSSMSGPTNMTMTDALGYFETNCMPGQFQLTAMAVGYMWEMSDTSLIVGANGTLWVNFTLDPATVEVHGTVNDALTGAPITGASVQVASLAPDNPNFVRMVTTSSAMGNYSVLAAPDNTFSVIMADCSGYESFQMLTSVPDVSEFWFNFTMLPTGAPTYTLQGYVTDSVSTDPIYDAAVQATFGMYTLTSEITNMSGFYSMTVPTVEVGLTTTATGYLESVLTVSPGAAGDTVWQNVTLDSHTEPPELANFTVAPDTNISEHRRANLSVEITEPYLTMVQLMLGNVLNVTGDTVWVQIEESYVTMSMFGTFWGNLKWQEKAPGEWSFYLPDWDATSDKVVKLSDASGAWWFSNSWGTGTGGTIAVWGQYSNSSLMFPMWGELEFDSNGDCLGFNGNPWTVTDETGMFWTGGQFAELNLTSGMIIGGMGGDAEHLEVHTIQLQTVPVTYPSGDYVAIYYATDIAMNSNFTFQMISVDSDAPVAHAGDNQTEIVGVQVDFDASLSIDNVGIANYTWTIEDGTDVVMYGPTVSYSFTTVGNHTVTVTVTDGAGHSDSASVWVNALADQVPVADAGLDQVVDEDTVVEFNGTASHDDLGITNYTWTIVGQTTVMYSDMPNCTFATPGVYHVRLVVRDTIGQSSAYDEVVIAVLDITAPTADAGDDQIVNIGSVMTFDGSGSSDNVGIAEYKWTFTDGTAKTLTGEHPTYTFSTRGNYTVTLTVNDTEGNSATDTMVVRVNVPPHADAGTDTEVSSGTEVTFDGSASSDDVALDNYTWTFTYNGVQQTLYGPVPKFAFDKSGTYTVQLTVKDVGGLTATDTVTVTVTGKGAGTNFLNQYWWLLAIVAIAAVGVAVVMLMRKRKGPQEAKTTENPPPPPGSDELEFPPPNDEEL